MLLKIDAASERPIYEQIADGVRRAVARGEILSGEKLPPASEVAIGLDVNKHTVLHAYQVLRDEGLVDLRRGRGAVVTKIATEVVGLHREVEALVVRAAALGIGKEALASLVLGASPATAAALVAGATQIPMRAASRDARADPIEPSSIVPPETNDAKEQL